MHETAKAVLRPNKHSDVISVWFGFRLRVPVSKSTYPIVSQCTIIVDSHGVITVDHFSTAYTDRDSSVKVTQQ